MFAELGMQLQPRVAATLPSWPEVLGYYRSSAKPSVPDVLRDAERTGRPAVQPRCGVGAHDDMAALLSSLEKHGEPDILTLTIDSYTRLKRFSDAASTLRRAPRELNGYPLVAHGWRRGRELNELVRAPLEVRHGSPDGRELFAVTVASGITSYEGGGITYNIPYCKDVPLDVSLEAWRQIDAACGVLASAGVVVDREVFGTLTAVLMPPSICLAICLLEAYAAAAEGVRCVSIAYPQGGEIHQDVAALRLIRELGARYLPPEVEVYPVLHQFMGVFPRVTEVADALILYGGLTARLGGATKIINKTNQEAYGIPDPMANVHGIRTTVLGCSQFLDFVEIDEERVAEEVYWLRREVTELVEPVLGGGYLLKEIADAFRTGRLDVPFSASIHARSEVIPRRDEHGAIRLLHAGGLPFSRATLRRNEQRLRARKEPKSRLIESITRDIDYFKAFEGRRRLPLFARR
jgi:methylaspartate mutase epsilon subunit